MSIKQNLQTVAIAAVTTLAVGGTGAYAATSTGTWQGQIHKHDIAKGAVTSSKIKDATVKESDLSPYLIRLIESDRDGKPGKDGAPGINGKDGLDGKPGKDGAPGAPGTNGLDGKNGSDGLDGGPVPGSSLQFNAPGLALDAAPGADGSQGSSGFGWDNEANAPVTSINAGDEANFTASAIQSSEGGDGAFVIAFDSSVLQFVKAEGCTSVDAAPSDQAASGWVVCNASLSHTVKGIGVTFKALKASSYTNVTVTVNEGGETASQIVPITVN